jgi:hypothetical protein
VELPDGQFVSAETERDAKEVNSVLRTQGSHEFSHVNRSALVAENGDSAISQDVCNAHLDLESSVEDVPHRYVLLHAQEEHMSIMGAEEIHHPADPSFGCQVFVGVRPGR